MYHQALHMPVYFIIPGYTVLVVGTNVPLSPLSMLTSLMECPHWTGIIPLPVIMDLDGLAVSDSP